MLDQFRGHFIGGRFVTYSSGNAFHSVNPATDSERVFEAQEDEGAVDAAVEAARDAASGWRRSGLDARIAALRAVQSMVPAHVDAIAEAISCEMGKTIAEARVEARSIAGKIDGVIGQIHHELPPAPPGAPGQQRFHPLGVMGIVGPLTFRFISSIPTLFQPF